MIQDLQWPDAINKILGIINVVLLCATLAYCGIAAGNIQYVGSRQVPSSRPELDSGPGDGMVLVAAEDAIKAELKDPDSAKFSNVNVHRPRGKTPLACGYVNARNGFGGYTGFEPFISNGTPGVTTFLLTDVRQKAFRKAWKELCRG